MSMNNENHRNLEQKALYISQDHCRIILSSVKELTLLIEDWLDGKKETVSERSKRISELEKEANKVKWDLLDLLSNATSFFQREDIMRLVTTADMIADNAEAVAHKISIAEDMDHIPREVSSEIKKMSDTVLVSMDKLRESIMALSQNVSKASEISKEVDEIEEDTDSMHRQLLKDLLISSSDYKQLYILSSVIEQLEETSDQIKATADAIRILSMSIFEKGA